MKNLYRVILILLLPVMLKSQSLTVVGGTNFTVNSGTNVTVTGDVTNSGTIANSGIISLSGNWTNNGAPTVGGVVKMSSTSLQIGGATDFNNAELNGTSQQTVTDLTGNSTFGTLNISNSNGASLGSNLTVTGTLQLNNAIVVTNGYDMILGNSASSTRGTGYVNGNINKGINAPQSITFMVGTGTTYSPVDLSVSNVNSAGSLQVNATDGVHPSVPVPSEALNRYWSAHAQSGLSIDYSINLNYVSGDFVALNQGSDEATMRVAKYNAPNWTYPSVGTRVTGGATGSIEATGLSSFSDFTAVKECPGLSAPVGTDGAVCGSGTVNLSASVGGGLDVDWYDSPSGGTLLLAGSTSYTTPSLGSTTPYYAETRDALRGCVSSTRTTVTAEVNPLPTFSAAGTDITCNGAGNGEISVSPSGGTAPYDYSVDNGGTYPYSSSPITGLSAATYDVKVRDNKGCESASSSSISISEPAVLSVSAGNGGPYIAGQTINLTSNVLGGNGGNGYSWNGPLSYSSTNANPSIASSTVGMSGSYGVTVTDANGCTASASTSVVVNGATPGYTWIGNVSGDWGTPGNWSPGSPPGGPNSCSDDVTITSSYGNAPVIGSAVSVGSISISANAQLTLNANLSVCQNWAGGSGTNALVSGSGRVILSGSSPQSLTGKTKFEILQLENSAGATLQSGASADINTSLDLKTGQFSNSGTLTFLSTSVNHCAILDNFSAGYTGTYTGSAKAQRYYAASLSYRQHFMGSPVDGINLSQFGASGTPGQLVATANCDETRLSSGSPYGTVMTLHENAPNANVCTSNQWYAESGATGAVAGRGYAVAKPGNGTLTLTGSPNLNSSYTLAGLTNSGWSNSTLQGHNVNSGWHLVSNPYLASLDISSIDAGFDDQIQVWQANGAYALSYQPGQAGSDAFVAPFQAFMVHNNTPSSSVDLHINAADRVRTPQTFFQSASEKLDIVAENTTTGSPNANLLDKTVVAFNANATDQFDPHFDANKSPGALIRHTLYTENNGKWMSRNNLNSIVTTSTVPMGFQPGSTGSYNLTFNGVNSFDPTSYIYLEDKQQGIMHDVRGGAYSFNADSADAWGRFVLHFTPSAQINAGDASCQSNGTISVIQPGTANWNYTLTDGNSTIVSSGILNETSPLNVSAAAGSYTLTLTDNNNYTVTKTIEVNGATGVAADFTASSTNVDPNQDVTVSANNTNGASYEWNFGNGQTATGPTATANYTTPGTYNVALTVTSSTGCTSTSSTAITVNNATGISKVTEAKAINIWSFENKVYVDFTATGKSNALVTIYDVLGRELSNEKYVTGAVYQRELNNLEESYVIVRVKDGSKLTTKKVLISSSVK